MAARPHMARLYAPIPPAWRRRLLTGLLSASPPAVLRPGISLIGYPFAEIGMGESLRSLAKSIEGAGVDYEVVNYDAQLVAPQNDRTLAPRLARAPTRAVNLFAVNADFLGSTMHGVGLAATQGRYNIVRPFWELLRIHPDWIGSLRQMDEIWATTTFIRDAFAAATDVPVTHIPMAVSVPRVRPDRARFGIPPDATAFLFAFDFSSHPARKNPSAVLDAYTMAFGARPRLPVVLVIKTMGQSPQKSQVLAALHQRAAEDPRIIVIDEVLPRTVMHGLTASCDVFVSLHRSEGFGLGIAEAMALGKPVVATDYSGSTDFVTATTGFPVPYRLIPVEPDDYPYFIEGQRWADPDLGAAARIMAELAANPDLRVRTGAAARQFMDTAHSHETVGRLVVSRLAEIEAGPPRR